VEAVAAPVVKKARTRTKKDSATTQKETSK
jgi:hypothetical protein